MGQSFKSIYVKALLVLSVGMLSVPASAHDSFGIDPGSVTGGAVGGGAGAVIDIMTMVGTTARISIANINITTMITNQRRII